MAQHVTLARVKSTNEWGGAPTGVLALDGDRLVFVTPPDRIKLDTTLDQCEFSFAKWMMGQGFRHRDARQEVLGRFPRPRSTPSSRERSARRGLEALGAAASLPGIVSVVKAPQLTKEWKEVLTEADF